MGQSWSRPSVRLSESQSSVRGPASIIKIRRTRGGGTPGTWGPLTDWPGLLRGRLVMDSSSSAAVSEQAGGVVAGLAHRPRGCLTGRLPGSTTRRRRGNSHGHSLHGRPATCRGGGGQGRGRPEEGAGRKNQSVSHHHGDRRRAPPPPPQPATTRRLPACLPTLAPLPRLQTQRERHE